MKTLQLRSFLIMVSFLLFSNEIYSQIDTDGSYQSASSIGLNSVVSETIGLKINEETTDYDDWYKFTIPSDGKIEIVQTTSSDLYSGMYAYDMNGTHEFNSRFGRKGTSDTLSFSNLGAGEYYVRINNWNYSSGSYTLKVSFTAALHSNDNEPNNQNTTASIIQINSEITGHVGYYKNNDTDYDDWYKFTTPSDGKIEIIQTPTSTLFSGMYAYDINGTHEFSSEWGRKGLADTLIFRSLAAGEYYIRVNSWNYTYGSYKLKVNFYPTDYTNDTEPNSIKDNAINISINTEITGHVGFYKNNDTDYDDWFKFSTPSDGKIEIVETPNSTLFSGMYVYDVNGTHEFWSKWGRKGSSDTLTFKNLGAGEYYIRVNSWNYTYGSYKLKVNFYPTEYNNDTEPNNNKDLAINIAINTEITGHVGFYKNDNTDYEDWYKYTIPSDGRIEIVEYPTSDLRSGMYLFDVNGTHEFSSRFGRNGNSDTLTFNNLAAGEYYIRISNWNYTFGSYKLKVNFFPALLQNDVEPNEVYTKAKQLIFDVESTGHVGYYSNDQVDYDDWYWFTLASSGKIKIVETVSKDLFSGVYLFNTNGTQELSSRFGRKAMADTLIYNDILPAGNYYIRVSNWNSCFGSYSLKVSNYNPTSLTDISDNNFIVSMKPNSGSLFIRGVNIQNIQIYDLFGKIMYNSNPASVNGSFEINVSNFSKGLYFLKIRQGISLKTEKFMIR